MAATALNESSKHAEQPESVAVRGVPIIVYQMGKVGSTTITGGLRKRNLERSVHHIHVLSSNKIDESLETIISSGCELTEQIHHSRAIRDYLVDDKDSPIDVITVVREPISQMISSLFQNFQNQQPHLIDADGNWLERETENFVRARVERYAPNREWNCNWFEIDFFPALGVDVYATDFDIDKGYSTIQRGNCRVLVLRLESSEGWSKAITEFLGLETPLDLVNLNVASGKAYKAAYREIKNRLKFDPALLDKIYGTKFCRHFYTPEMIAKFKQRWSNGPGG